MDILGRERDRLQSQLDESHQMLAEAHEIIKQSHVKFLELIDSVAKSSQSQSRDDRTASAAILFSQNRRRKPVTMEENNG